MFADDVADGVVASGDHQQTGCVSVALEVRSGTLDVSKKDGDIAPELLQFRGGCRLVPHRTQQLTDCRLLLVHELSGQWVALPPSARRLSHCKYSLLRCVRQFIVSGKMCQSEFLGGHVLGVRL